MKHKIISIIAAAAAVLSTAACNRGVEVDPNGNFQDLPIQPDALVIDAEGVDGSISFDAPDYWFANCPDKWVTVDPYSGKPGKITLDFKVAKNTTSVERTAVITVNAKSHKGKITITQGAWPYTDGWSIVGTVGGSSWDKDFAMEDQGDRLVWKAERLPYHAGEEFKFRMGASDAVSLGLEGAFNPLIGGIGVEGKLSLSGSNITLPLDGYWDISLDLVAMTMTANLVERFAWTMVGTIGGGDWGQDIAMADLGNQLLWEVAEIPYHVGEEFRFRMDGNDIVNLGLDGELFPIEELENTYVGHLMQDGANIALPADGFWSLSLDVQNATLTAVLVREFSRVHEGMFWENEDVAGTGAVSWSSQYRFGMDGRDGNHECLTTFPEEVWNRIKTEPFYLVVQSSNPQIRLTTGWWSAEWVSPDIQPGSELLTDNGDGTWTAKINLSDNPAFVDLLDVQHLLLTGDNYTPLGIYPVITWENKDPEGTGAVSWSSQYRFGKEGNDGNNECLATFPESVWNKLKTGTFYLDVAATNPQIRLTTGWWSAEWVSPDLQPGSDLLTDNGDGTWTVKINLGDNPSFVDLLDVQHLLFTGDRYTPLRIRIPW